MHARGSRRRLRPIGISFCVSPSAITESTGIYEAGFRSLIAARLHNSRRGADDFDADLARTLPAHMDTRRDKSGFTL